MKPRARRVAKNSKPALKDVLDNLERVELLRRLNVPELEYIFKHVLTQESAYESLLVKARREIHRRVAESYEALYTDRLDEFAALLARHYAEAGDQNKTLDYSTRAGDSAARVYANAEAILHYTRAIQVATQLGFASPLQSLYLKRGRVFQLAGDYDQALNNYTEMEQFAREHNDRAMELAALLERMTVHSAPTAKFDVPKAQALAEQALNLARDLRDRPAEAKILWNLSLVDYFRGYLQEALNHGETGLAIARELNLREQMAFSLNDLHNPYISLGQIERAQQALAEARELWRALDNKPMLADNLITSSRSYYMTGQYDQALAALEEGNRIAEAIGNLWGQSYSRMNQSFVYLDRGEYDSTLRALEEGIRFGDQAGFLIASVTLRALLAFLYAQLGALDLALEYANDSLSRGGPKPGWGMTAYAVMAYVHIQRGELDRAEDLLREKAQAEIVAGRVDPYVAAYFWLAEGELMLARRDFSRARLTGQKMFGALVALNTQPFQADALYLQAQGLRGLGQTDEAFDILNRARANAEAITSKRILWEILARMSEIESARGNEVPARELKHQAREVLDAIITHIPTQDLRESFLNLPRVKKVLRAE